MLLLLIFTTATVSGSLSPELQRMINSAALVITSLKSRKLLKVVSVFLLAQQTKAASVPSFVYQYKTTEAPPKFFLETIDIETEHLILAICICTLFCAVILTFYTIKCRSRKTQILAEITNGNLCVRVPLKALTVCPSYWKIQAPSEVSALTVRGKMSPTLEFEWDKFNLTHNLTNRTVNVEKLHRLSILKGRKLREILKTTNEVHFFVQHDRLLIPIH